MITDPAREVLRTVVEVEKRFTYKELSLSLRDPGAKKPNETYVQQWVKRGKGPLPEEYRQKLAAKIGRTEDDLRSRPKLSTTGNALAKLGETPNATEIRTGLPARHPPNAWPLPGTPHIGGNDVPVMGRAQGGPDGALKVDNEPIDWVPRVPAVASVKDAYALFVDGESMVDFSVPHGATIYVNPNRRPIAKQLCVLRTTDGLAYIKRFVKVTASEAVVEQSNPSKQLKFSLDQVEAIHWVASVNYV